MEIANHVINGARLVTPLRAELLRQHLPSLKLRLADMELPGRFPHLQDQVDLLLELFEDVLDGEFLSLPYTTFAEVVFALEYLAKSVDIIPDSVPELGLADDSAVVRCVLMRNEVALSHFTASKGISWSSITTAS